MIILTRCVKVYGKTRTYYIHSPFCRAVRRLERRLGRTPTKSEISAELKRLKTARTVSGTVRHE